MSRRVRSRAAAPAVNSAVAGAASSSGSRRVGDSGAIVMQRTDRRPTGRSERVRSGGCHTGSYASLTLRRSCRVRCESPFRARQTRSLSPVHPTRLLYEREAPGSRRPAGEPPKRHSTCSRWWRPPLYRRVSGAPPAARLWRRALVSHRLFTVRDGSDRPAAGRGTTLERHPLLLSNLPDDRTARPDLDTAQRECDQLSPRIRFPSPIQAKFISVPAASLAETSPASFAHPASDSAAPTSA